MISDRKRKYKFYKIVSLLLMIVLTFLGVVSIVSFSMFLYKMEFISIFGCIILDFILGSLYSLFVNLIIGEVNYQNNKLLCEIDDLEYNLRKNLSDVNIKNNERELRYDSLSRDSKIRMLNDIKDNLCEYNLDKNDDLSESNDIDDMLEFNNVDNDNNDMDLLDDNDRGYSRKLKK